MATEHYRQTYSWTLAIELGRKLGRVVDQLPADERPALGLQLQSAFTELPAAIGEDLLDGSNSRQVALVRVYGILDLIESIYPSLDLGTATTALAELAERLSGDEFDEEIPDPAAAVDEDDEDEDEGEEEGSAEAAPVQVAVDSDTAEADEEPPSSV